MAKRHKRWAARVRAELMEKLGGRCAAGNLQILCEKHNSRKGALEREAEEKAMAELELVGALPY